MEKEKVAQAGSFCWNEACADYGQAGKGNIIKNGKTDKGVQRYRCQTCKKTFTQTKGTLFYRCRHSGEEIVECLAMVGDRNSRASIHRMKGIKEETVCRWMQRAATQVEQIEEQLLEPKKLSRVQLDALWTYVGHKGEKGGSQKKKHAGRIARGTAIDMDTRVTGRTCDSQDRRRSRAAAHETGQKACTRRSSSSHVNRRKRCLSRSHVRNVGNGT